MPAREIAVTIDDLPVVNGLPAGEAATTRKLLAALARHHVRATGFVVGEAASGPEGEAQLRAWLAAGHDLGNHTWSHPDFNKVSLATYTRDVAGGEAVVARALGRGSTWFRHPYLHAGATAAKREGLADYLAAHGARVAPVTIDNGDWAFAAKYAAALRRGDRRQAARVRAAYAPYMATVCAYFEGLSRGLFGREPRQILLLHASALNADAFDDVAAALRARGYRFVTLERAMADPAYASEDAYVGPAGISWLMRWAAAAGVPAGDAPEPPAWVLH